MRNCYFVIFNGRGWEKRRGGRRVRDYIFRRDSTDVHWHVLRSQLPRQGARFALDSSISLNDGSRQLRGGNVTQPAARDPVLPPPPLLPRLNFRLYMCWPHMSPKLTFPTSLAPLHNLPYTFRPRRESRGPIAGSTFPPRRGYISSPFHEILIKSWTPLFTFLLVNQTLSLITRISYGRGGIRF